MNVSFKFQNVHIQKKDISVVLRTIYRIPNPKKLPPNLQKTTQIFTLPFSPDPLPTCHRSPTWKLPKRPTTPSHHRHLGYFHPGKKLLKQPSDGWMGRLEVDG